MGKPGSTFDAYEWVTDISNRLIIELKKAHNILEEAHTRFFSNYNISYTKFNVLVILFKAESEGIMLSEIGDRLLVTKANITGLIDRLEKQGYVKRIRNGEDRRKIMAAITEKGRVFTQNVIESYKKWSDNILSNLKEDEKNQMINALKKIQLEMVS